MANKKTFSDFTNLYSLSKTLRFELQPVGKTEEILKNNGVFETDKKRKKAYENTKPYFDRLHREFISESLANAYLDGLSDYFKVFQAFKKDRKNQLINKQIDTLRKSLREQIVGYFDKNGKEWATKKYFHLKIKRKDLDILFEEEVFQILKHKYGNEKETKLTNPETDEIISIFNGWKGFTGYFIKFFATRKNFYKAEVENGKGKSGQISTRIVDQNLDRFLDNLITYDFIKGKIDITEVEKFFELKAGEVFSVDFYNYCLLQDGIDKYNDFLGGKTVNNGEKIRGVNEIINKYRQDNKGEKLPFLKKLDKQILSEKEKFIDEIETPEELLEVLREFYDSAGSKVKVLQTLLNSFFKDYNEYDLNGIYLSKEALNTISNKWTNETETFGSNLYEVLKSEKILTSSAKKTDGGYSFPDFISIANIKASIERIPRESKFWKERYYENPNGSSVLVGDEPVWEQFLKIFKFEFFSHFERTIVDRETGQREAEGYDIFKSNLERLLKDFKIDKNSKLIIKDFADEVLYIYQMAKYFALEKKRAWNTEYDDSLDVFYTDPNNGYFTFYENAYKEIVQPYNKIRNFLTKKPYSEYKWKLNFDNPTLADGWDKNKESDNTAVILRKEGKYYLGIMKKGHNQIFQDKNKTQSQLKGMSNYYEKLVYKQMADPKRDFPKGIFSKKGFETYNPPEDIIQIYEQKTFKTESLEFSKQDLWKLIDFYKICISLHPSWKLYDFSFSNTTKYENLNDFYSEVSKNAYKTWFESISENYIADKNNLGELFLFRIYNKDFSDKSTGTKNLHTLYFKELFSQANMENNFPFKLNGQAELFYRPKSIDAVVEKRNFKREIVNKKRYSENKIFFHVPITLNRVSKNVYRFNTEINNFLANNSGINIIGVDRGEKHLVYYSVINQKGEVLDSESLNTINQVDYHEKLEERADDRKRARKNWEEIEGIKDLKKGYISQVVRKLADLAIKHNAIIVMEDLNMRFKQIRGGIEKSAYQQLEKALIGKLNFLVNKGEVDPLKTGHLLSAYQLTALFETFKDMGKQTGIIFYTQASYTSRIDPLTGWRPNIYLKYSNADQAKKDILKFSNINFNEAKGLFEFTYDIKDFSNTKDFPIKTKWTVCSNVKRFRWDRKLNNNKGGYTHYKNLTDGKTENKNPKSTKPDNLKELFEKYKIDVYSDIKNQIQNLETKRNEKFFQHFIFFFNLICQIRNTQQDKDGDENDFILSPVEPFFDSRYSEKFGKNLPQNGDDNGAYNIARKGIIILDKISKHYKQVGSTDKLSWNDLYISHMDWDDFAQS